MTADRVIIVGATATGKSQLAVAIATRLLPAGEVVNADSRQVIRGLDVATAKPVQVIRQQIPHHVYDVRDPGGAFTVADWLQLATGALADIKTRGHRGVVAGGTGLYVDALLDGLDPVPPPDPAARLARSQEAATGEGRESLVRQLLARDPGAAGLIDIRNPRRVIRALEILDATGEDLAASRTRGSSAGKPLPEGTILVGLSVEKDEHHRRISQRAAAMFDDGSLVAEVDRLLAAGTPPEVLAASGIGYAEALGMMTGELAPGAATEATIRRTVRYAKAQATYFRRNPRVIWIDATAGTDAVLERVTSLLERRGGP